MAKDIKQVVDFDVSRGANAINKLTDALRTMNLTIDDVAGATGSKFNKAGKAQILTVEAQVDAFKKLEFQMKLVKNAWEVQARVVNSNVDAIKKARAETERYIALTKNLENAGRDTGIQHGPGFAGVDGARQQLDYQLRINTALHERRMIGLQITAQEKEMEKHLKERARLEQQYANMRRLGSQPGAAFTGGGNLSQQQMANELKVWRTVERAKYQSRIAAIRDVADLGRKFLELTGLMKGSNDQLTNFMVSLQTISRVVWFSVLYSQMYRLIFAFREGMHNAIEFERRLAEIQTLTQRNAQSTAFWADTVRQLSDQMGNPILDTAEGIYEAISNQIVQGGENTHFFNEELKLALITVSSFEDAVNSTSSVINSFNMSANDASKINAILFKTVDLGRVRLSEMANSLGRVSVLSDQLGISFIEQQAALAVLTQSGLKWNVAQTFYGNILQKLIRPSERMTEIFTEWGVTSGEAAIKTFGWVNVMKMLEQEAQKGGDEMAEIGEIFQRIRAITGFTVLNQEKMVATINEMKGSATEANKAFDLINENIGQKMRVELNKIKNLFTVDFGRKLLETTVEITDKFGGLSNVIKGLINVALQAARMYLTFRVNLLAVNAALLTHELWTKKATIATGIATIRTQGFQRALQTAKIEAATLNTVLGNFAAVGLTLIIEAFVQAHYAGQRFANTMEEAGNKAKAESDKFTSYAVENFIRGLQRREDAFNDAMSKELQVLRGVMSILRKENTALAVDLEESFKLFANEIELTVKPILDSISDAIKQSEQRITEMKNQLEKVADVKERLQQSQDDAALDRRLAAEKDEAARVNLIWQQANQERLAARELLGKGELEQAEKRIRRAEQLEEKALHKLDKIRDEKNFEKAEDKQEKAEERANKKLQQLQIDMQRAAEFARRRGGRVSRSDQMTFQKKRQEILEEYNRAIALAETKDEIEKKATDAAETRKKIEEDIVEQNRIYMREVEEFEKRRKEALAKEQKTLKENQDFELKFKKELEDVTKFDPKKNEDPKKMLARFDKEANEALDLAFDPRLTMDQYNELVAKVEEQRLKIVKESERLIAQEKQNAAQQDIQRLDKLLKETQQKQKDAAANTANQIKSILDAGSEDTKIFETFIKNLLPTKNAESFNKQKEEINATIQQLTALKAQTLEALNAGNTDKAIQNFEKYKKSLKDLIDKIAIVTANKDIRSGTIAGKATGLIKSIGSNDLAGTGLERDDKGKLLLGDRNIDQIFTDMQQKMQAFEATSAEFNASQRLVLETNAEIIAITKQAVNSLPLEYRAAAQAAIDAAQIQEEANKSVAASLQLIIDKLYEVIKLNDDLKHGRIGNANPGQAFGGGFAFGGAGADTMMGLFRKGETVINPQSSRIFEPVLAAINRTRTSSVTPSSSVINVGDITINGSNADGGKEMFDQFMSRVKRAKRRGQI